VRFPLDHDVPGQLAAVLRRDGHSVLLLRDVLPIETDDSDILKDALPAATIVITCNRDDFLDLCKTTEHYGVIIMFRRQSRSSECSAMLRLIRRAGEQGLIKNVNFA
jgi:predicted nuclease of predicted toxin-antitoxin system